MTGWALFFATSPRPTLAPLRWGVPATFPAAPARCPQGAPSWCRCTYCHPTTPGATS